MLKDIDWDRKRVRLRGGKGSGPTGEEAYAYFMLRDEESLTAIRRYTAWRGDTGPIFMISPRKAQALVKRAGERCGLHLTPHLLRHACATHLLQLRVGIAHVQTQLRHKSIETTRRYTRITGEDMEQVRERLKEASANA
jgi:integrase/recombinase XerD